MCVPATVWYSYGVIVVHYVVESIPKDETCDLFITACMSYLESSGFDI
jgi:hypothetical protein